MRKKIIFYVTVFLLCVLPNFCLAQEIESIPSFTKDDKILVLVPHPDDEAIGLGGIMQEAVQKSLPVKVVYYTNGDNNELAFIVYEKRILIRKKAFVYMGEVRRKESVSAMKILGLDKNQLVFLGYPDFGTMTIFTKYWQTDKPFRSMFPRQNKVPYPEALSFGAPYIGESILKDVEAVVLDFKPTKIFVSHPMDTNGDHRSLFLFLQVALWNLEGKIQPPQVYPYLVHVVGWPKPRGFHPKLEIMPPKKLADKDIKWLNFELSDDEIQKKKEMTACFKSQIACNPPYLYTFSRKNELFGSYPYIALKENKTDVMNWQDADWYAGISSHGIDEEISYGTKKNVTSVESLVYAKEGGFLCVKISLRALLSKTRGVDVYLFGYNKKISFASMPKIRIHLGWKKSLTIFDKEKRIFVKDAVYYFEKKGLIIKFPLAGLGFPQYILTSAKTKAQDLPLDATSWRILKLE